MSQSEDVQRLVKWLQKRSVGACGRFVWTSKGSVLCHECEHTILAHHYREAADTIERLLAEVALLRDWQVSVTAALQRPGGAFYEDMPKHGRELRARVDAMAEALERSTADRDAQVREAEERAFMAGYEACDKAWRFNPLTSDLPPSRASAFAAYLTRQPAAVAHTEEQKP